VLGRSETEFAAKLFYPYTSDGSQNNGPITGAVTYLAEGSWAPGEALRGGPPGIPGKSSAYGPGATCASAASVALGAGGVPVVRINR